MAVSATAGVKHFLLFLILQMSASGNSRTFIIDNVRQRSHCLIKFIPLFIQASEQIQVYIYMSLY